MRIFENIPSIMAQANTAAPSEFVRPDLPSRCTWSINADPASSPHTKNVP